MGCDNGLAWLSFFFFFFFFFFSLGVFFPDGVRVGERAEGEAFFFFPDYTPSRKKLYFTLHFCIA